MTRTVLTKIDYLLKKLFIQMFIISLIKTITLSSVAEPGAVEPPYFAGAGAGAVIFVKKRLRLRVS